MHYEGLLRVPCIVRGPGVPAGKIVTDPVSTLDLGTTFCDYAETEPLLPQHGRSLRPLIVTDDSSREFALNEWELLPARAGVALSLRTVRARTAKMTVDMISGVGELYDLASDPNETINLYDAPSAAGLRSELEAMLASRPDDIEPNRVPVGMA